jgi:hypothetical protein
MKQIDSDGNSEDVQAIFCAIERAFFEAGEALAGNGSGELPESREATPAGARPLLVGAALVGSVGCAITLVLSLA